jgi:hypothetical protein
MNILATTIGWILAIIIGCFGAILIFLMATGKIDLSKLLNEPGGDASTSRFQFVIFTFVIAMSLFLIVASKTPPAFPDHIPPEILLLLGISAGSYIVSKGIQKDISLKQLSGKSQSPVPKAPDETMVSPLTGSASARPNSTAIAEGEPVLPS